MKIRLLLAGLVLLSTLGLAGCSEDHSPTPTENAIPVSASGVKKATTQVKTDLNGETIEQKNIKERLAQDNQPGSIKHLYVISPFSGQVLLYSTVRGKVTSGSKRLSPTTVVGQYVGVSGYQSDGRVASSGGQAFGNGITQEMLSDDGAYGSSSEYIYWFDSRGKFHQHFRGQCEIHISNEPMPVHNIVINLEKTN